MAARRMSLIHAAIERGKGRDKNMESFDVSGKAERLLSDAEQGSNEPVGPDAGTSGLFGPLHPDTITLASR